MDVYASVTDSIVKAIEAGAGKWRMPWHSRPGADTMTPVNAASGRAYNGINVLQLWAAAESKGFADGYWGTYRQWQGLGAQVRQGERATTIVYWNSDEYSDKDTGEKRKSFFARAFYVFNASQVDGWTPKVTVPVLSESERIDTADAFFKGIGADVRHGGNIAAYVPALDYIALPDFGSFETAAGYYGTTAHEHVHWSGAKKRLDRDLSGRFKSESYAVEELVAELGAAFTLAKLGLASEPRPDHAQYIGGWLKALKNDKRALFTAASAAQKAADFLATQAGAAAAVAA